MPQWSISNRHRNMIVACVAAATLTAAWWKLQPANRWGERPLALHFYRQTSTGTEQQVLAAIGGLDRLGDVGTPFLVALLDSPRETAATATQSTLLGRVDRLRRIPSPNRQAHESTRLVAAWRLAAALASKTPEFDQPARSVAARLAVQLLALAADFPANTPERERLIICCDEVLAAAKLPIATSTLRIHATNFERTAGRFGRRIETEVSTPQGIIERLARLPGGTLPLVPIPLAVDGTPMPRGTLDDPSMPARMAKLPNLRTLESTSGASLLQGKWRTPQPSAGRNAASPQQTTQTATPMPTTNGAADNVGHDLPEEVVRTRAMFRSLSLRDLIWSLRDQNPVVAEAAAEELRARRLSEEEVEIARQLTSPNAQARRRLVDDLPTIRGIAPRPWLFLLAEDEDSNVRLAALSLLATAADPPTQQRVADLASRDQDPRIVRLADRLAQMANDPAAR